MADAKLTALSELSIPSLDDLAYIVDDPAGTPASYKVAQNRLGGMYSPATCQGRLTTESGVPISTSDRTAQSTIYFTPYLGDRVALYDGTRWKLYAFTERSLALSGLTSAKPYDVFLYDNAGTLTLEVLAWTSDTARATALTTQDSVYVKTGATTRRYVGTIYTTAATTTEDSNAKRFVWNAQHAVRRPARYTFSGGSNYTYSTATYRAMNNDTTIRVAVVAGLPGGVIDLTVSNFVSSSTTTGCNVGIDEDGTTGNDATLVQRAALLGGGYVIQLASLCRVVAVGLHYYQGVELGGGGGVQTWNDSDSNAIHGLSGTWTC